MIDNDKAEHTYTNSKPALSKHERGFTLIEVMVALAILAVVTVAASRASSAYLSSVDVLRTRTLAQFVAQNAAADLRIQDTFLIFLAALYYPFQLFYQDILVLLSLVRLKTTRLELF